MCKKHVQYFKTLYYPPPTFRPPQVNVFVMQFLLLCLHTSCYNWNFLAAQTVTFKKCNGTNPRLQETSAAKARMTRSTKARTKTCIRYFLEGMNDWMMSQMFSKSIKIAPSSKVHNVRRKIFSKQTAQLLWFFLHCVNVYIYIYLYHMFISKQFCSCNLDWSVPKRCFRSALFGDPVLD